MRGFWAAWGGLVLDGMDSFIYALVLVPAMRDLLPRSGIEPTIGNLGFYGRHFVLRLPARWGCAFLWDRLRSLRTRTRSYIRHPLLLSIYVPGLHCAKHLAARPVSFSCRLRRGWRVCSAAVFVAEELPGGRRVSGAGYLNAGYYVGIFLAAALNYLVGARLGWRAMFAVGLAPALFVAYIRYHVREPERWTKRIQSIGAWTARDSFFALFSPEYRKRTTLKLHFSAGLDAGSLGRIGVCARCRHPGCASRRIWQRGRGSHRLMGHDAVGHRHNSWLLDHGAHRQLARPPRGAGLLLRHHGGVDLTRFWLHFYPGTRWLARIHRVPVLPLE